MLLDRSDKLLINKFKRKFGGPPQDTALIFGDWAQRQNSRFMPPSKGVGFRKLFRRFGYQVFLTNESRTSKSCNGCQQHDALCEKFKWIQNPDTRKNNHILCHGLLRCTICGRFWNRDVNAARNIRTLSRSIINGQGRPTYLTRLGRARNIMDIEFDEDDEDDRDYIIINDDQMDFRLM
jgi:hypothetical protein